MKKVKFGKFTIGRGYPCVIIMEVADSHGGSVEIAKKMIDQAKLNGADIVKFQFHLPDLEMVPGSIQMWDGSLYDILKKNLLSPEDHRILKEYCDSQNIMYLCTPFSMQASDELEKIGVEVFKIGSGEMNNLPMIRHIAKKGKTMMISTGMSTIDEIKETVKVVEEENCPYVLAHCVSEYPTKAESLNLGLIEKYQEEFKVPVGFSSHALGIYCEIAAVALGANFIEKHFTLDKKQKGPDHFISIEPMELKEMSLAIHEIEKGLGNKKVVSKEEQVVRDWAYHSVVTNQSIEAGTVLTKEMLTVKRPGSGIPAKELEKVIGRKLKIKTNKDTILQWNNLE